MNKDIKLFDKKETNFEHNKWVLSECLEAKVTEDTEGIFDLDLVYPLFDSKNLSQYLIKGNIIKCPISTTDVRGPQLFKIRKRIKNTKNKTATIYAQAIARADLMVNWVAGTRILVGKTRKQAIAQILANCVEQKGYYVGNLDTNPNTSINLGLEEDTGNVINYLDIDAKNPLAGMLDTEKSIKLAYGGEIIFNNKEINMVDERGADNSFTIESGKNLEELEEEIDDLDSENFATALTMQSSDGYYLPNQEIIYSPNASTMGNYFKKIVCDDVTAVDDSQTAINIVYAQLRERAQKAFNNGLDKIKVNNTINFIQLANTEEYKQYALLEKCELGNNVTVKYPRANIEATGRVTKIVFNSLRMKIEEVEIGERKKQSIIDTITSTNIATNNLNDKHNDNKVKIKKAKSDAKRYTDDYKVVMDKRATDIELSVTHKVDDTTYQSYIILNDKAVESAVKKNDFGSMITQHYDEIVQAIVDATGTHTCTFNGLGLEIQNGGFKIKNQSGKTVFWINSNGVVMVSDLYFDNQAFESDSNFSTALSNMKNISFGNIGVNGRLTIHDSDFYIYYNDVGGYDLNDYVKAVAHKMLVDEGLI